jgi:hypothetical protein
VFWPKDFFPLDIPAAQVLTYSYDADTAFGSSTTDIVRRANKLLESLIDNREKGEEELISIIFIPHSLRRIAVKQVRSHTFCSQLA